MAAKKKVVPSITQPITSEPVRITSGKRGPANVPEEIKAAVIRDLGDGMTIRGVQKKYGFAVNTIMKWRDNYNRIKAAEDLRSGDLLPAKIRKIGINREDIQSIARQVVRGLTETEACMVLGLDYQSWRKFKEKMDRRRWDELVAYERGNRIDGMMGSIELHTLKDWRAADRLLTLAAPERFGKEAVTNIDARQVTVLADEATATRLLASIYGDPAPAQPAIDVSEPKQIEEGQAQGEEQRKQTRQRTRQAPMPHV